jgi:hypothetical protein
MSARLTTAVSAWSPASAQLLVSIRPRMFPIGRGSLQNTSRRL